MKRSINRISLAGITVECTDQAGRVFEVERDDNGNIIRNEEIGPYYTRESTPEEFEQTKKRFTRDFELGKKLHAEEQERKKGYLDRVLIKWKNEEQTQR